jgi:hypothetical protein
MAAGEVSGRIGFEEGRKGLTLSDEEEAVFVEISTNWYAGGEPTANDEQTTRARQWHKGGRRRYRDYTPWEERSQVVAHRRR